MAAQPNQWSKLGPESYFPSIEKKYGRSIAEWQKVIADCGLEKHMQIVNYLKTEYQMGHGHANALVGWTLAGNRAKEWYMQNSYTNNTGVGDDITGLPGWQQVIKFTDRPYFVINVFLAVYPV